VRQYLRALFPRLLDRDRFNARRRDLVGLIEAIRCDLRDQLLDRSDPIRLVASAPVTLLTYTRGDACHSVAGKAHFGVVTSKQGTFFGWRLHTTVTGVSIVARECTTTAGHMAPPMVGQTVPAVGSVGPPTSA